METLDYLATGLMAALQPMNLAYAFVGVLLGTMVGVLPGLGPAGAIALLLPVTFHVPSLAALIMLAGITYGAQYGGSTTSILVNLPGEPSSMITCLDGYAMARSGRAGPALGIAAFASFIAGTASLFGLAFLAPPLAEFALRFGPPEYFALIVFALVVTIYLIHGSMAKGFVMILFGVILSTVGLDPVTGGPRFTYNVLELRDGLGLSQVVIGLFGISEVMLNLERSTVGEIFKDKIRGLLPSLQDWRDSIFPIVRGSLVGFFSGVIPGLGVVIPTFMSYSLEKRISRNPAKFETGAIEGVAGPEAANNAASCGGWIPLLSLGIPTGAVTALVFGALMIHGIVPGPLLIKESPGVFWGLIGSMYVGNLMLLVLNLPLIGLWVKALEIPYYILFPTIVVFSLIASYSVNQSGTDMLITIGFGLIGYVMKKFGYEAAPLVLGLVLGPMLENAFRRSMVMSRGSFLIFLRGPISAVFIGLVCLVLVSSLFAKKREFGSPRDDGG